MKVVFISRQGLEANILFRNLSSALSKNPNQVSLIWITETGRQARKQKLRRIFEGRSPLSKVKAIVNVLALMIFNFVMASRIKLRIPNQIPKPTSILRVADVNDPELARAVSHEVPNFIFNYGTGVYSVETIRTIGMPILNIHSGKLPHYRNVHTDFWAFTNNDLASIGISLFEIDAEIDSGRLISWTPSIVSSSKASLADYKFGNLLSATQAVVGLISGENRAVAAADLTTLPSKIWPTPTAKEILGFFFGEIASTFRRGD